MGIDTNFYGKYEGEQFSLEPPAGYDPENPRANPAAMLEMREYRVREKFVDMAKAQIIRDRLQTCYRTEGVNHYQNCKELAERYVNMIKSVGVHRYNTNKADQPQME
mmetsp:Transcript_36333/g.50477  ORF Transcript_36333/g.50477 Transcript_36333/m.50477 type:complete len:107 (+) Transcript_36333:84-404(+)|eukprot:CAMPEP_0196579040 /NCGR_PEP_ID=MMETSP1081-20130531/16325_1 /TAXON_ID=36882 /ORGANISM="Pyramimonas amylifera, Strain CCMP720" /LENGTH=106 /DNA_ID=CAMNT_0041898473 /DNA_START=50 /DNA_END=370 /DNA_ORIENTATION=+